jgi:hypothetical protein
MPTCSPEDAEVPFVEEGLEELEQPEVIIAIAARLIPAQRTCLRIIARRPFDRPTEPRL